MSSIGEEAAKTLTEIEKLEAEIVSLRSRLEHPSIKIEIMSESAIVVTVVKIRGKIVELGKKVELAISLGIDPMRSEILRLKANYGHYWTTP